MGVLIVVDIFKHQRRYGKWNRSQIYYGPKSPFYFSPSWVVYHLPRFLSAIKISFMWRKSAKKCWINVQLEINVFMCVQLFKLGIFLCAYQIQIKIQHMCVTRFSNTESEKYHKFLQHSFCSSSASWKHEHQKYIKAISSTKRHIHDSCVYLTRPADDIKEGNQNAQKE